MRNIVLHISFNGTNYAGYQIQQNANTITNEVQKAIGKVFDKREDIKGCSRTDSKVHAIEYVLNFFTEHTIPIHKVPFALNCELPEDIVVNTAYEAKDDFHARYSTTGKQYLYKVYNKRLRDPFLCNLFYQYPFPIDEKQLNQAAQTFVGTHDFLSFAGKKVKPGSTVRTVFSFEVTREGDFVYFRISGDGFLYNMVRILVGTLLGICEGRIDPDKLREILKAKDRTKAGKTAPPQGLYLEKVFYLENM